MASGGKLEEALKGSWYIKNSVPLQKANKLIEGEEYFDRKGSCYRYHGERLFGSNFQFVKATPLMKDECLEDIAKDEKMLKLFWVLAKNMR
jgi:hypothetical protein